MNNRGYNKTNKSKDTEAYTWFEKPKSYCLKITVKITVRQIRTLIRTLRQLYI
jgi:hypothetical protein